MLGPYFSSPYFLRIEPRLTSVDPTAAAHLLRLAGAGPQPAPTVVLYLWHAATVGLIDPVDILRAVGTSARFGAPPHHAHYTLLLELVADTMPMLGATDPSTAAAVGPGARAVVLSSDDDHTAVAATLLSGLAALLDGVWQSAGLSSDNAVDGLASRASLSPKVQQEHSANAAAGVRLVRQMLESPHRRMLLLVARHQDPDAWARAEQAWDKISKLDEQPEWKLATIQPHIETLGAGTGGRALAGRLGEPRGLVAANPAIQLLACNEALR